MTHVVSGTDPVTGRGIAVSIEDGLIAAIEPADATGERFLSPGLVDLQVNGYAGIDLNSGRLTVEEVIALGEKLLGHGVTSFAPTLITAAEESICQAAGVIAKARKSSEMLRRMIPFIHVEGPSISPEDGPRGAHPVEHVRPPDSAEFRRWQAASGGLVGLVTVSPHWPEAPAYIAEITAQGVHVSIGHTAATPEQISAAIAAGARLSTHLGNGAAATLPRHPNFIWTQLDSDELTASFIADGHHLPPETLRVMLRAKGLDRSILVSDVVSLGGMPPGRYTPPIGGSVDVLPDNRINVAGTPYLAGAGVTLDRNVAIAVGMTGLTLGDILPLATRNPGRFAGKQRGRLDVGAPADLVCFRWQKGDPALDIQQVFLGGERVAG